MRLIDADRLLEERRIEKYYHLPNGDIAIPIIDIKHAPTVDPVGAAMEEAKHACEDCQEFLCDGCEYYGMFDGGQSR